MTTEVSVYKAQDHFVLLLREYDTKKCANNKSCDCGYMLVTNTIPAHTAVIRASDAIMIECAGETRSFIHATVNTFRSNLVCKLYLAIEYLPYVIVENSHIFHFLRNRLHRDDDLPAMEYTNGSKRWYIDGKRDRIGDKPSFTSAEYDAWYKDDKQHRDGAPAVIHHNTNRRVWICNDKIHRDGNLPAVEDGAKSEWWVNGEQIIRGALITMFVELANKLTEQRAKQPITIQLPKGANVDTKLVDGALHITI